MTAIAFTRVEVAERMTSADFFRLAPETQKAELIDGAMIVASPASTIHEQLFSFLFSLLRIYCEDKNLGTVLGSRTAVELALDQVYEPDILFVAREREHIIESNGVFGAPDLVIEILSASTASYDRGPKFRGYEAAGVKELWLIDPYGPAGTEFYRLESGRYVAVGVGPDQTVRSQVIPGFWLKTNWLWPGEGRVSVREALAEIEQSTTNGEL
ncbi:MAG: Uma2 family endonuclease [Chloroflexi bacterium]|nr:Uma2 family endonuclease [Chloroflexota bacterium]